MTWQPTDQQLADALAHAGQCQPAECCGVIAGGRFLPVTNRATDFDSFIFDSREYIAIARQDPVEAIVHSHVKAPPHASEADRAMCEKLGLPWLIVSWPGGQHAILSPTGWAAPLVGRQWVWGSQDCFSLVRDALWAYAGLSIPDFERDWNWWKSEDLIGQQFHTVGFAALPAGTPPRHCDVFGMRMPGSPVVNHLALFLAPDQILHQLVGQLSRRQLYDETWQRLTALHLRREGMA